MGELLVNINRKENIINEFQSAFRNKEFYLVFQPQVEMLTHRLVGIEVLIRWENERLGFVPPNEFIAVAEECGYIKEIGYFVLKESIKIAGEWLSKGYEFESIAINVSPIELGDKYFVDNIMSLSEYHNVPYSKIQLEITEKIDINSVVGAIETLIELKELGYLLAIDDYGAGNSKKLLSIDVPVDTLKLDKSLVDNIHSNQKDVIAIIRLAERSGFQIIAEGVEFEEQIETLIGMNCNHAQGYHYSKPLKEHEMVLWF